MPDVPSRSSASSSSTAQRAFAALAALLLLASPAPADLAGALDAIVNQDALRQGHVGLAVYDPEADEWLFEHNADRLFVPASTMKLAACGYALSALGADLRLSTRIVAGARPAEDGTLQGDLWIVGGGEPFTTLEDFQALADQLHEAGLRRITGAIRADTTRFGPGGAGNGWCVDDLQYWYGALPEALNVNRQRVLFTIEPAGAGEPAKVSVDVPLVDREIVNRCTTVGAEATTDVDVTRLVGSATYRVTGTIRTGGKPEVLTRTFDNPADVAVEILRARLVELGIEVAGEGPVLLPAPEGAVELARHDSDAVTDLVHRTLKTSDNFATELLSWNVAVEKGKGRSFGDADQALYDWLKARGLPMDGVRTADASGLSRYDLVTPRFLCELLALMRRSVHAEAFRDSLPLAGVDGTLGSRFEGSPCEGVVRAKTGWMSRIIALAGYAPRPDGSEVCFAFLQNFVACPNDEALKIRDSVPEAIVTEE